MLVLSHFSFSQLGGFSEIKKNFFFKSVTTKSEAIKTYSDVISEHGYDTLKTPWTLTRNPLVFSNLVLDKKVLVGFIIAEEDLTYSILFYYIKNVETYFFDVKDVDGKTYEMFYIPE